LCGYLYGKEIDTGKTRPEPPAEIFVKPCALFFGSPAGETPAVTAFKFCSFHSFLETGGAEKLSISGELAKKPWTYYIAMSVPAQNPFLGKDGMALL
jgi:hypothetical protein